MQFREEPWPPTNLSEWARQPSQVNDFMRQQMTGIAQCYANQQSQQNNYVALGDALNWPPYRYMTASDLGIIDQNLDDKIGMEPPTSCFSNPPGITGCGCMFCAPSRYV